MTAVAGKGIGLGAKLVIGGSLAAVTAGGVVLGQQATAPDTVRTSVTVNTRVVEVNMPGERKDDCLKKAGGTTCTTVVTSEKGTTGPVRVKPVGPLPDGVRILYWGCEEGAEARSCTVRADKSRTVCISTSSPADRVARQNCAKVTGSPRPVVRTEKVIVVAVDPSGEPLPGWAVLPDDYPLSSCDTSRAAVGTDIVSCDAALTGAAVCWVNDDRVTLFCGVDPWEKTMLRFRVREAVRPTAPATHPIPWAMELADGTRCRIITVGGLTGRFPNGMLETYNCTDTSWIVEGPRTPLLDTTAPGWTVQVMDETAVDKGDHTIPPRTEVTKVYYAGRPERE